MPAVRQRTYSEPEVEAILRASESRLSARPRAGAGHTAARHVAVTNADLIARGDRFYADPRKEVPLVCAFGGRRDAVRAITEALNSVVGRDALGYLDHNYPTGIRVGIEARVAPIVVRYSSGLGIKRNTTVPHVFVLVERIEDEASFGIHLHTAYPILSLRNAGRPGWQDPRHVWHSAPAPG